MPLSHAHGFSTLPVPEYLIPLQLHLLHRPLLPCSSHPLLTNFAVAVDPNLTLFLFSPALLVIPSAFCQSHRPSLPKPRITTCQNTTLTPNSPVVVTLHMAEACPAETSAAAAVLPAVPVPVAVDATLVAVLVHVGAVLASTR